MFFFRNRRRFNRHSTVAAGNNYRSCDRVQVIIEKALITEISIWQGGLARRTWYKSSTRNDGLRCTLHATIFEWFVFIMYKANKVTLFLETQQQTFNKLDYPIKRMFRLIEIIVHSSSAILSPIPSNMCI